MAEPWIGEAVEFLDRRFLFRRAPLGAWSGSNPERAARGRGEPGAGAFAGDREPQRRGRRAIPVRLRAWCRSMGRPGCRLDPRTVDGATAARFARYGCNGAKRRAHSMPVARWVVRSFQLSGPNFVMADNSTSARRAPRFGA